MLIRFVTSNFLSFNEEREFNMLAGSYRTHKHHVYNAGKLKVLKSAAIYGANGAGKSNLVKAIDFFQKTVKNGGIEKSINPKKFKLNKKNTNLPTEFEIEFYFKRKIYAYGISINKSTIEKEWLCISGIDKEDKLIFERKTNKNGTSSIEMGDKYMKTQKDRLLIELMEENILKNDELLLGKSESLKITDISNVREWVEANLVIIYPNSSAQGLIGGIISSKKIATFANELLKTYGTGVESLDIENIDFEVFFGQEDDELKNELIENMEAGVSLILASKDEHLLITKENNKYIVKKIVTIHNDINGQAILFDLSEESDGTQRLLDFIPVFFSLLNEKNTFIIDEIDQSLHPTLLYNLVKKIMADETTTGQLVFTTHESDLLDLNIFRQDEIWFAEKNKTGSTQLYPLSDFKPRYDLDIRKGYLKGRFGAIPFTGNLKNLNWQETNA